MRASSNNRGARRNWSLAAFGVSPRSHSYTSIPSQTESKHCRNLGPLPPAVIFHKPSCRAGGFWRFRFRPHGHAGQSALPTAGYRYEVISLPRRIGVPSHLLTSACSGGRSRGRHGLPRGRAESRNDQDFQRSRSQRAGQAVFSVRACDGPCCPAGASKCLMNHSEI